MRETKNSKDNDLPTWVKFISSLLEERKSQNRFQKVKNMTINQVSSNMNKNETGKRTGKVKKNH